MVLSISPRPELRTNIVCHIDHSCSLSTLQVSVSWCLHNLHVLQEHQIEWQSWWGFYPGALEKARKYSVSPSKIPTTDDLVRLSSWCIERSKNTWCLPLKSPLQEIISLQSGQSKENPAAQTGYFVTTAVHEWWLEGRGNHKWIHQLFGVLK